VYGFGRSEEILGRVIGKKAFVAGKCGLVWDDSGEFFFETEHNGRRIAVQRNLTTEAVIRDCENSLGRLKRDSINLYQIHWPLRASSPGSSPAMEEAFAALWKLREEGKILGIGICNATAEHLAAYKRSVGSEFDSVQMRLGLLHKTQSAQVLAYARKNNVSFLAYGALSQGALTCRTPSGAGDLRASSVLFGEDWQTRIADAWKNAGIPSEEIPRAALSYPLMIDGVDCVIAGIRNETHAASAALAGQGMDSAMREILERAFEGLDYRGK